MRNVNLRSSLFVLTLILTTTGLVLAGQAPQQAAPAATSTPAPSAGDAAVSQILDRVIGTEAVLSAKMRTFHPLVETYLQSLDKDDDLAFRPVSDQYFIGKLDFNAEEKNHSLLKADSVPSKI